ncbi:MAG: PAS domain S-box protein [Ignavibacteriae bacterium]|nr:PAS domain S-box protein [Ignavibacteriota bacterium]
MSSKNKKLSWQRSSILSPFLLLVVVALSIFLSEGIIMYLLQHLHSLSPQAEGIIDAFILTLIIFPVLYIFVFRPMVRLLRKNEEAHRELEKANTNLEIKVAERTSELTTTNKALRESEERFRSVAQSATEAIIVSDSDGNIISWNGSAQTIFGYIEEEIIGQSLTLLLPERYRDAHRNGLARYRATEKSQMIGKTKEYNGLRKDGSEFPLELSLSAWKQDDTIYFCGIIRDITERKQTEIRLKTLSSAVEQTADNVFITDNNGVIQYVNHAFTKTTGYSSEEAIGKTPRILKSGKHDQRFYEELWGTIRSGYVFSASFINKQKNGELYWDEKTITPIKDQEGVITHFVSTAKDFTKQKLAEQEREKLLADLQEAFANIKTLKGLIPICASCKKIRDDKGFWQQVEGYIMEHSDASFSHGICPGCIEKLYPEIAKKMNLTSKGKDN